MFEGSKTILRLLSLDGQLLRTLTKDGGIFLSYRLNRPRLLLGRLAFIERKSKRKDHLVHYIGFPVQSEMNRWSGIFIKE